MKWATTPSISQRIRQSDLHLSKMNKNSEIITTLTSERNQDKNGFIIGNDSFNFLRNKGKKNQGQQLIQPFDEIMAKFNNFNG